MFRSRILVDRKMRRRRGNGNDNDSIDGNSTGTKEKITKTKTIDGNNNNSINNNSNISGIHRQHISISKLRMSNRNFDFIEPCDIVDELNNEVDSLDSVEIKNWRYHLTNNRF